MEERTLDLETAIIILLERQSECKDEMLWHDLMKQIDELESEIDLMSRGIKNGYV